MWVLYIPHHIHDSGVGLEEALTIGGMENCNLYLISTNNKKKVIIVNIKRSAQIVLNFFQQRALFSVICHVEISTPPPTLTVGPFYNPHCFRLGKGLAWLGFCLVLWKCDKTLVTFLEFTLLIANSLGTKESL